MPGKAVFLDRDKTLIEDPGYLSRPEGVRLLPGVSAALRRLQAAGYKLVIVSNQAGVAKGRLTLEDVHRVQAEVSRQLAQEGVRLDAFYFCPFHPEGTVPPYDRESDERKPSPGMLTRAARELDIELAASWMVGDRLRDVEAGRRAGCRTIHVPSDEPETETHVGRADFQARDLSEAVDTILAG